tara:strand:+ start:515 stop:1102 length:588 start_codon:yes stop_codon:yes gene_type:complete
MEFINSIKPYWNNEPFNFNTNIFSASLQTCLKIPILAYENGLEVRYRNNSLKNLDSLPLCKDTPSEKMVNDCFFQILNIDLISKEIKNFKQKLQDYFQSNITANFYLNNFDIKGLPRHYDDHHVLIFQIFGKKKWWLHKNNLKDSPPYWKDHPNPPNRLLDSKLTYQNTGLYIPRHYWHRAEPQSGISAHISFGI